MKRTAGLAFLFLLMVLASCVPQKKIRYFQDKAEDGKTAFIEKEQPDYLVKPGDNLYIRIKSIDKEGYAFGEDQGATNYYSSGGIYFNGYSVDNQGNIKFPLIGDIRVDNLTIEQVQQKIQGLVDEYIKNTVVVVKLGSFRVTMLGEVNRPGELEIYQDKLTIYEAIAMAGDLTTFARRDKVVLIRQNETGTSKHVLNLNDQAMLESEYLFLVPQDIVYIEPVRAKAFAFDNFPYALVFTTLTTVLLLIEYFK
jgi:polysaccharide export outer membrane protein